MKTYILEDKIPIPKPFWGAYSWRDDNKEKHQLGQFVSEKFLVSTVFIGMDYGYSIPPLLFETMIFNKER